MDEIPRYTDLAHTIQLARAADFSTREIVRVLSGSLSYLVRVNSPSERRRYWA